MIPKKSPHSAWLRRGTVGGANSLGEVVKNSAHGMQRVLRIHNKKSPFIKGRPSGKKTLACSVPEFRQKILALFPKSERDRTIALSLAIEIKRNPLISVHDLYARVERKFKMKKGGGHRVERFQHKARLEAITTHPAEKIFRQLVRKKVFAFEKK